MKFTELIPTHIRSFNINDPAINYPFRPEVLSGSVILLISLLVPISCTATSNLPQLPPKNPMLYMLIVIGNLMIVLLTRAAKHTVGALRPNFLDLCQVNTSMLYPGQEYINRTLSARICTGSDAVDGRQSFPSAHCSQVHS